MFSDRRKFPLFCVLLGIVPLPLLLSCGEPSLEGAEKGTVKSEVSRASAPELSLKCLDGETIRLSDYRGKVLVVNFWATWCPPCIAEIPHFVDLYRDYKDKNVQVVGVSMDFDADPDYIQEFCREAGMDYPIAKVKDYSEVQKIDRIWSAVERIPTVDGLGEGEPKMGDGSVMMMPTTFIIDQDGYIFRKHIGPRERKDLEPELLMLLKRGTEEAAPRL